MQRLVALKGASPAARAGAGGQARRLTGAVVSARAAVREDERLARRVASGSRRAVAALSARYSEQLYAYCYLLLHDTDAAYEALQATLARAVGALRRGGGEGFLRPWLFRIAREEAGTLLRASEPSRGAPPDVRGAGEAARAGACDRSRLALLADDLRALPELQRSALLMREVTGLSHKEVASALEISPQSVKQAIFHARRALAELEQGRSLACEEVCRTISHGDRRRLRRRTISAHLRSCGACADFAAAIPERRAELQALVPVLAPALAGRLLAKLLAGGRARPKGGLLSSLAGKSAGAGLAGKTALAAAVAVTAATGTAARALVERLDRPRATPPAHALTSARAAHPRSPAQAPAVHVGGRPSSRGRRHGDAVSRAPVNVAAPVRSRARRGGDTARGATVEAAEAEAAPPAQRPHAAPQTAVTPHAGGATGHRELRRHARSHATGPRSSVPGRARGRWAQDSGGRAGRRAGARDGGARDHAGSRQARAVGQSRGGQSRGGRARAVGQPRSVAAADDPNRQTRLAAAAAAETPARTHAGGAAPSPRGPSATRGDVQAPPSVSPPESPAPGPQAQTSPDTAQAGGTRAPRAAKS